VFVGRADDEATDHNVLTSKASWELVKRRLYDRRQKKVTRNIVERISI
jgi:hypothetical protein